MKVVGNLLKKAYTEKFIHWIFVCLFDLIIYVPSTIFQLYRDGSSWFELDGGEARTRGPLVSSQALYHCATALPNLLNIHML